MILNYPDVSQLLGSLGISVLLDAVNRVALNGSFIEALLGTTIHIRNVPFLHGQHY